MKTSVAEIASRGVQLNQLSINNGHQGDRREENVKRSTIR